jgi:hypothetical protein
MKKYITFYILVLTIALSSCGDEFLRLYPPGDVVAGAPSTRRIIDENVTGAYQILLFDCFAGGQWMPVNLFFDALSDNFYTGGENAGDQPQLQNAAIFNAHPSVSTPSGWWNIFYAGLKRVNGALNAIDNAVRDTATDAWLAGRKAEMLTLRAYYVHWLWKAYGDIPYFDDIWTDPPFIARQHTREEIYHIIMADLDAAIATPSYSAEDIAIFPMTRARAGEERGRVHKAMAMMLRARVVMHFGDQSRFAQVRADMEDITDNYGGHYRLVTEIPVGANNFTGLRGSNATTASLAPPTTNYFEWIFLSGHPGVSGANSALTGGGEFSTESVFEVTHATSHGKIWGNGWRGLGTYTPRFTAPRVALDEANNWFASGWGFMPVRPDAYALFSGNDIRRDATVSNWGAIVPNYAFGSGYQNTGLWLRKHAARWGYNIGTGGDGDLNFTNNKRIFRIAEAHLIAAELHHAAGGGGAAGAQRHLDAVRSRAGLASVPATLQAVKFERRLELFGEGMRFWDLLRWNGDENGRPLSVVLGSSPLQNRTWDETRRLLPIPQSEIDRVAGSAFPLKQNPGYTN